MSQSFDETEIDVFARETGQPRRAVRESLSDYQARIAREMLLLGCHPDVALRMLSAQAGEKEARYAFSMARQSRLALSMGLRDVLPMLNPMGSFRRFERVAEEHGFERFLDEPFFAPHIYLDDASAQARYVLWARPEEGVILVATEYLPGPGSKTRVNEAYLYAGVTGYDPHRSNAPFSRPSLGDPDCFWHVETGPVFSGEDGAFTQRGADGQAAPVWRVRAEGALSFLADVRAEPRVRFASVWPSSGRIPLALMLQDYSVPRRNDRADFRSCEWEDSWDFLAPWQQDLHLSARQAGIDLLEFQAGRRLSLLPSAVWRIVSRRPEVPVYLEAYRRGLEAGLQEPGVHHPRVRPLAVGEME